MISSELVSEAKDHVALALEGVIDALDGLVLKDELVLKKDTRQIIEQLSLTQADLQRAHTILYRGVEDRGPTTRRRGETGTAQPDGRERPAQSQGEHEDEWLHADRPPPEVRRGS
jgi:hypothetical protein